MFIAIFVLVGDGFFLPPDEGITPKTCACSQCRWVVVVVGGFLQGCGCASLTGEQPGQPREGPAAELSARLKERAWERAVLRDGPRPEPGASARTSTV